jgi:hypothetical protein
MTDKKSMHGVRRVTLSHDAIYLFRFFTSYKG